MNRTCALCAHSRVDFWCHTKGESRSPECDACSKFSAVDPARDALRDLVGELEVMHSIMRSDGTASSSGTLSALERAKLVLKP